eukprot:g1430.t1
MNSSLSDSDAFESDEYDERTSGGDGGEESFELDLSSDDDGDGSFESDSDHSTNIKETEVAIRNFLQSPTKRNIKKTEAAIHNYLRSPIKLNSPKKKQKKMNLSSSKSKLPKGTLTLSEQAKLNERLLDDHALADIDALRDLRKDPKYETFVSSGRLILHHAVHLNGLLSKLVKLLSKNEEILSLCPAQVKIGVTGASCKTLQIWLSNEKQVRQGTYKLFAQHLLSSQEITCETTLSKQKLGNVLSSISNNKNKVSKKNDNNLSKERSVNTRLAHKLLQNRKLSEDSRRGHRLVEKVRIYLERKNISIGHLFSLMNRRDDRSNRDNEIRISEFELGLQLIKLYLSIEEIQHLYMTVESSIRDASGYVTWQKMKRCFENKRKLQKSKKEKKNLETTKLRSLLRKAVLDGSNAIRYMDNDSSGLMNFTEFKQGLLYGGFKFNTKQAQLLFRSFDANKQGVIHWGKVKKMLVNDAKLSRIEKQKEERKKGFVDSFDSFEDGDDDDDAEVVLHETATKAYPSVRIAKEKKTKVNSMNSIAASSISQVSVSEVLNNDLKPYPSAKKSTASISKKGKSNDSILLKSKHDSSGLKAMRSIQQKRTQRDIVNLKKNLKWMKTEKYGFSASEKGGEHFNPNGRVRTQAELDEKIVTEKNMTEYLLERMREPVMTVSNQLVWGDAVPTFASPAEAAAYRDDLHKCNQERWPEDVRTMKVIRKLRSEGRSKKLNEMYH